MTQHQYYANDWQYDRDHGSGSTYVYMFTTALADRKGKLYFAVSMRQLRLTDSPSEEESVPEQRPMVITPLDGSAVIELPKVLSL